MDHWMFHCKEVTRKVSESMDRRLPLGQRLLLRLHFTMCKYCSRFYRQMQIIRNATRAEDFPSDTIGAENSLSSDAKSRIKRAIEQETD